MRKTLVVTLLFTALIPVVAMADALGWVYWPSALSVNLLGQTIGLPGGQFTHGVKGSGNNITLDYAEFLAVPPGKISNWRIDFIYYDLHNNPVRRNWGTAHISNDGWGRRATSPGTVPYGRTCALLYTNGIKLAEKCLAITR